MHIRCNIVTFEPAFSIVLKFVVIYVLTVLFCAVILLLCVLIKLSQACFNHFTINLGPSLIVMFSYYSQNDILIKFDYNLCVHMSCRSRGIMLCFRLPIDIYICLIIAFYKLSSCCRNFLSSVLLS